MANVRIATATRNAMLDQLATKINAAAGASPNQGYINVYDGSQPANANTAITTQNLLAQLRFSQPAAPSASGGVLTFSTIVEDSSADATGTAAWARITDADGNTIFDCDVSTSGATLNFNTVSFVAGGPVRVTSFTLTYPAT